MAKDPITIVTFLWRPTGTWRQGYTAQHVNTLCQALKENLTIPHRVVCVTDMPKGIKCETISLWKEPVVPNVMRNKPNCYKRLRLFAPDIEKVIGAKRFASIDLDCIITKNVDSIFDCKEDFRILKGYASPYNGSLMIMDAGARAKLWNEFDPKTTPNKANRVKKPNGKKYYGSDQAVISYLLPFEPTFSLGPETGIYQYTSHIKYSVVPKDARMVFFAGRMKPWFPELRNYNRTLYAKYRKQQKRSDQTDRYY